MAERARRRARKSHGSRPIPGDTGSANAEADVPLDPGRLGTVQATQAKNRFGEILKSTRTTGPVFIERHGKTQAVVLDIAAYNALVRKAREPQEVHLDTLREEFDALYARMQSAKSRRAVDRLFSASAEMLNGVAAKRARSRG